MRLHKPLKILIGLIILFSIAISAISINHPIMLKWLLGSARKIGKPMHVKVYTNGKLNNQIKVFHIEQYWNNDEKANNYLLYLNEYDSMGLHKFLNINLNEQWIGIPIGTSKKDYDFIAGHLFQSETGGHFTPLQNNIKGIDFEPKLSYTDQRITFNLPSKKQDFDSIRIELK